MINPNPSCDKECRFKEGPSFTTMAHWERLYDKNGNLVTKDPNTTTGSISCIICGKSWSYVSVAGSMKFEEKK